VFRTLPPHPSLAHLVRAYGTHDMPAPTPATEEQRVYPECKVTLAFLHGESYLGVGKDAKRLPRSVYIQEFRDLPVRLYARGPTRMVAVQFFPWGAIRLLGPHVADPRAPFALPKVVDWRFVARMERLVANCQDDEALRLLEQWLLDRAAQVDLEAGPALMAASRLFEAGGQGTVAQLAEGVGLSVRQLERLFQTQVGMTPKLLARITRFEAAQQQIFGASALSFTRLAHDLGYADQAHFSREFRAFARLSPGGFAAETRAFARQQGDVAFVQAERSAVF
jgi:AraC-like DNA-binding protein